MNIIILDDYQDAVRKLKCAQRLEQLNAKVFTNTVKGIGQLAVRLRDAEVLVLIRERTQFPRQLLEKLPKLKLISQTGRVGSHIDLETCTRLGIAVTYRIEAFDSGDAGPVGRIEEGRLRLFRPWPAGEALAEAALARLVDGPEWPRVDILLSHAGVDGALVDALVERGTRGIVVAGTGHGTVHHALESALLRAQAAGVRVLRCSRVAGGPVFAQAGDVLTAGGELSPYQARIELLLQLLLLPA